MPASKSSWKQKVDPAFDKFIKLFIKVLPMIKLPANEGYISLDSESTFFQDMAKDGFPELSALYNKVILNGSIFNPAIEELGNIAILNDLKNVYDGFAQRSEDVYLNGVYNIVACIGEDSKSFYMKIIEKTKNTPKEFYLSLDEKRLIQLLKEEFRYILSLTWQVLLVIESKEDNSIKELKGLSENIIMQSLLFAYDMSSFIVNLNVA